MMVELFLARRYLRPRRSVVSFITFSSLLGVTLGVAVLLIVLAVMTGFTDLMKEKIIETQSHFQVRAPGNYAIGNYSPVIRKIEQLGALSAPVIRNPVLVQYGRGKLDARCMVLGARSQDLVKRINLKRALRAGEIDLEGRGAIIGEPMARRMGLRVGDKFILHSANRLAELVKFSDDGRVEVNRSGSAFLPLELTVRGVYSLGMSRRQAGPRSSCSSASSSPKCSP